MDKSVEHSRLVGSLPVCAKCGASAVVRDAWATWSRDNAEWQLQAVFDASRCDACDAETTLDWKVDEAFRRKRIRALNDELRCGRVTHGAIMVTPGIQAMGDWSQAVILRSVAEFSDFSEDNDPHGEHDFGAIDHGDRKIFWKIDYYDLSLQAHSPDAANPELTKRVLTIMLADEY